jgi:hypothetical protein
MPRYFSAYLRHACRNAIGDIACFFAPRSRSTLSSIAAVAVPPGPIGASMPIIEWLRTTTSFRILLRAVPRWMWPFA